MSTCWRLTATSNKIGQTHKHYIIPFTCIKHRKATEPVNFNGTLSIEIEAIVLKLTKRIFHFVKNYKDFVETIHDLLDLKDACRTVCSKSKREDYLFSQTCLICRQITRT